MRVAAAAGVKETPQQEAPFRDYLVNPSPIRSEAWRRMVSSPVTRSCESSAARPQRDILTCLDKRVVGSANPRRFGKSLKSDLAGLWRYRVGDYRILCQIRGRQFLVLVIAVGHRKNVYE